MAKSWTAQEKWTLGISITSLVLSTLLAIPVIFTTLSWHLPGYRSPEYLAGKSFVRARGSTTISGLARTQDFALLDSPAYVAARAYYLAWVAYIRRYPDATIPARRTSYKGSAITQCYTDESSSETCDTYADFVIDQQSGQLTDLSVNGHPLAGRVVHASDSECQDGWCYRVEGGYFTPASKLISLVVSFTNNSSDEYHIDLDGSFYYSSDSQIQTPQEAVGLSDYNIGGIGYCWLTFDAFDAGGQLVIPVQRKHDDKTQWDWFVL